MIDILQEINRVSLSSKTSSTNEDDHGFARLILNAGDGSANLRYKYSRQIHTQAHTYVYTIHNSRWNIINSRKRLHTRCNKSVNQYVVNIVTLTYGTRCSCVCMHVYVYRRSRNRAPSPIVFRSPPTFHLFVASFHDSIDHPVISPPPSNERFLRTEISRSNRGSSIIRSSLMRSPRTSAGLLYAKTQLQFGQSLLYYTTTWN